MEPSRLLPCRGSQILAAGLLAVSPVQAQDTELLSVSQGLQADGRNTASDCSDDGRFVVWQTLASNLVPQDGNSTWDVLLLDRETGEVELVSRTPQGEAASGGSTQPSISGDGRIVAFYTNSTEIQPGLPPGIVFYDRITQTYESAGVPGFANGLRLSGNGRWATFVSGSALVAGDTNFDDDIYRFDRVTQNLERVSVTSQGAQSNRDSRFPSISRDGRYIAFDTWAQSGAWGLEFSTRSHVWRKDMQTGLLEPVSSSANGEPGNGVSFVASISGDGTYVAFETAATNIALTGTGLQIVAKNMATGAAQHASVGSQGAAANNYSYQPVISGDGRFVAFRSAASNLPGGGTNAYYGMWVRDLALGITRKVSLSSAATGQQDGTSNSYPEALSLTGRFLVFSSEASNLVSGDTNGQTDIFVRDITGTGPYTYGWSPQQSTGCLPSIGFSGSPSASAGSGFFVELNDVRSLQPGLLIYSKSGPSLVPLFGSHLYVAPPVVRTTVQGSGGLPGTCDGEFLFDFNAWTASGQDLGLVAGTSVWAQYWSRDPGDPDGAHLSDAVAFVLAP